MDSLFKLPEKIPKQLSMKTKTTKERSDKIKAAKKALIWPPNYHIIKSSNELGRLASLISQHGYFSFDTETSSLNPYTCKCYCVTYWVADKGYLINFEHPLLPQINPQEFMAVLASYHQDDSVVKYGFNIAFDSHVLQSNFGLVPGYQHHDASTMSWVIYPDLPRGKRRLKRLCELDLNIPDLETFEEKFGRFAFIVSDPTLASHYAILDAELHYKLSIEYLARLKKIPILFDIYKDLDQKFQNKIYDVEQEGFPVDVDYVRGELSEGLQETIDDLEDKIDAEGFPAEFNMKSPDNVAAFLFDILKLPRIAGNSTDVNVLEELQDHHPAAKLFKDYRKVTKLKSSFVDNLLLMLGKDNKVHPSFRATGTVTGRPTSENPNLYNQPARIGNMIRKAFMAPEDYIMVSKDFEGQELRIMSHFAGPGPLREVLESGRSMYAETAVVFYGCDYDELIKGDERRDLGKKGFLAKQYLARGNKMAKIFNCTKKKGDDFCNDFDNRFVDITAYTRNAIKFAKKYEYTQSILGRRRYFNFSEVRGDTIKTWKLEREVNNSFIQSSASDQTKLAFIRCDDYLKEHYPRSKAKLEIYDEILFYIHKDDWCDEMSEALDEIMRTAITFSVPMVIKTEVYLPGEDGFSHWGVV